VAFFQGVDDRPDVEQLCSTACTQAVVLLEPALEQLEELGGKRNRPAGLATGKRNRPAGLATGTTPPQCSK